MVLTNPHSDIRREIVRLARASPGVALADLAGALLPYYSESHTRGSVRELAARGVLRTERVSGKVYVFAVEDALC